MLIAGFWLFGWTTTSTAQRNAKVQVDAAVVAALVPFCVAKAETDTDAAKLTKFRAETSSYSRTEMVRTNGWAMLGSAPTADYALTQACSDKLQVARAG